MPVVAMPWVTDDEQACLTLLEGVGLEGLGSAGSWGPGKSSVQNINRVML